MMNNHQTLFITIFNLRSIIFILLISALCVPISCNSFNNKKKIKQNRTKKPDPNNEITLTKYYTNYQPNIYGITQYSGPITKNQAKGKEHLRLYYNKKHQLLFEEHYNKESNLILSSKFFYKSNKKIKEKGYDEFHELIYQRSFDNNQKLIKEESFASGEAKGHSIYSYNKKNLLVKKESYNPDHTLLIYETFKYNKRGEKIRFETFNSNHKIIFYETFEYDKNNKLILIHNFDANNTKRTRPANYNLEGASDYNDSITDKPYKK